MCKICPRVTTENLQEICSVRENSLSFSAQISEILAVTLEDEVSQVIMFMITALNVCKNFCASINYSCMSNVSALSIVSMCFISFNFGFLSNICES